MPPSKNADGPLPHPTPLPTPGFAIGILPSGATPHPDRHTTERRRDEFDEDPQKKMASCASSPVSLHPSPPSARPRARSSTCGRSR
jgi:hypothetical protein